jgi:hypothetical protein
MGSFWMSLIVDDRSLVYNFHSLKSAAEEVPICLQSPGDFCIIKETTGKRGPHMKDHNYYATFIEAADDCPAEVAEIPKAKGDAKTVPVLQYEMIANHPYQYTQEDVLFEVFAIRNHIPDEQKQAEREKFFSKGQPCLRTSSLGKRYGWGIHIDGQGKVALYAVESEEYRKWMNDSSIKHVKAMRTSRA